MTQIINVDGMGQLGTRVWPSIASLPAVRAGALAVVDDGTNATLYFGGDLSGTLSWIPLISTLSGAILKVPPSSFYNLITTPVGGFGLGIIHAVSGGLAVSGDGINITVEKETAPTSTPLIQAQGAIDGSSEDWDVLQTVIPSSPEGIVRNVSMRGVLATRVYPDIAHLPSVYLGAIAVVDNGTTGTAYFGADVAGVPTWTSLRGPTGATGAAGATGATGATPLFNAPAVTGLSYGSEPTLVQSGDGSSATPYHQVFGIPAGVPGSFDTPDLPAYGAPPVTIELPCLAVGTFLPWLIPNGYTIQVIGGWGMWFGLEPAEPTAIFHFDGTGINTFGYAPLISAWTTGACIAELYDDTGAPYSVGGHAYSDPRTAITLTADSYISFLENLNAAGGQGSNLILKVKITPAPAPTGTHVFDFTVVNDGWATKVGITAPVWVSGSGLQNAAGANYIYICRQFAHSGQITSVKVKFAYQSGSYDIAALIADANPPTTTTLIDSIVTSGTSPIVWIAGTTHLPQSVVAGQYMLIQIDANAGSGNPQGGIVLTDMEFGYVGDPF